MLATINLRMDAVALEIGSLQIRWYGIFVALGFLAGMIILQTFAKKRGMRPEDGADLALPALVGGILGARVFYVLQFWSEFQGNLGQVFAIHKGGLVFYGGFIGATVAVVAFSRWRKLSIPAVGDLFGLGLPIGQALGRLGCLFNGCCFGQESTGFWSILYPMSRESVYQIQLIKKIIPQYADSCHPVLPVQVNMAITNLVVFIVLVLLVKRIRTPGRIGALSLMLYAVGRFCNEFFRGDHLNFIGPFTVSQVVSLILFPIGLTCWILVSRNKPASEENDSNDTEPKETAA